MRSERRALIAILLVAGCSSSTSTSSASTAPAADKVVNAWKATAVDPAKLPLGDKHVSTTAAGAGQAFVCQAAGPVRAGADVAGPWIDQASGTWDLTKKVSVRGNVTWPAAEYGENVSGTERTLVTNGLPVKTITGDFPIKSDEAAYKYDRNPNVIKNVALRFVLPTAPQPAAKPSCLPMGPIGLFRNGVALFSPIDEAGRDAVAWETQDVCEGHPQQQGEYHYHDVASCLVKAATGSSTVIGWAADGYPIVVERDAQGHLPSNQDLDECHGRTSPLVLDGKTTTTYHYSATQEFPYVLGCFHATPVRPGR
jgi:YHYH protein